MLRYIIKRLLQMVLVLFLAVTLVFVLLRCIGDPSKLLLSPEGKFEDLQVIRMSLGLDKPMWLQYVDYMKGILSGNWGNSFYYSEPVLKLIAGRLPATLLLALVSIILTIPFSIFFGIVAAQKRNTFLDSLVTTLSIIGRSMPTFWLGLLLVVIFAVNLNVLPPSGYGSFKHLIMPAITMAAGLGASTARMTRSSMLEVLRQDYMVTARAKGVKENRIVIHHGFRNAMLSVITMLGIQIGKLLCGSVVVETVFSWPGIGRLMVGSILNYDYPLVQACAIIMALLFAVINFVIDMLYTVIDPRIKYY